MSPPPILRYPLFSLQPPSSANRPKTHTHTHHIPLSLHLALQKNKCHTQYNSTTPAIIMPLSLKMATLLPDDAMRVRRVAEPLSDVANEEKVSL